MSVIDSGQEPSPVHDAPQSPNRSVGLIIGLIVLVLALLMITPFVAIALVRGAESPPTEPVLDLGVVGESAPAGFAYFGDVALQQGSTITTTVTGEFVQSTDDVEIVTMPDGIEALIFDAGDDIVQLEIIVPNNMPTGRYIMTFRIAGEPEIVDWLFEVLPR